MAPKRKVDDGAGVAGKKNKKQVAAASGSTAADLKKGEGDWTSSSVKDAALTKLRNDGFLPPSNELRVRAPSAKEVIPEPREGERVLFVDAVHRGMAFPLHDFVRGLLYAYGVQIHDFTPNGILHIAVFMTLCECFLGVHPSWALWKSIFRVRPNCRGGRTYPVGGLQVQVRQNLRYFNMKFVDSAQGWRKKWFYAYTNQEIQPMFASDGASSRTKAWSHKLNTEEALEAAPLITRIGELLHHLSGMQIIATFVRMRVWPLQARSHPMWEYEGPSDCTRISPVELSANELASHVRMITCTKSSDEVNIISTVKPYSLENPISEVIFLLLFYSAVSILLICLYSTMYNMLV